MQYIVLSQSGVNQLKMCFLGSGSTRKAALEDAFGPDFNPRDRAVRRAEVREVSDEEADRWKYENY